MVAMVRFFAVSAAGKFSTAKDSCHQFVRSANGLSNYSVLYLLYLNYYKICSTEVI